MQQTIIYLENLCQTLTAQTASARQDAEIQTQVREVMFRELKGEIKDFQEENEELKTRLDYYVEELKDKIEENKKLKDKIEELRSSPEIPETERENYREEICSLERHVCNLQTEIDIMMGR